MQAKAGAGSATLSMVRPFLFPYYSFGPLSLYHQKDNYYPAELAPKHKIQAFAAAKFADVCLRGLRGDAGIVECSFVASQVLELLV